MPKSKSKYTAGSQRGAHHPYPPQLAQPPSQRAPRLAPNPPRTSPNPRPLIPFDALEIGQFYNCAISFQPQTPGGRAPSQLPKHRVLVTGILRQYSVVRICYLSTFRNKSPSSFHKTDRLASMMYLPVGEAAAQIEPATYMAIASNPPCMKGWLNFGMPVLIEYSAPHPDREKLRSLRESVEVVGPSPRPARCPPVRVPGWALEYVTAMNAAWETTIHRGASPEKWVQTAAAIQPRFLRLRDRDARSRELDEEPGEVWDGEDGEGEWAGIEEDEWAGIEDGAFDGATNTKELDDAGLRTILPVPSATTGGFKSPQLLSPPATIRRQDNRDRPSGSQQSAAAPAAAAGEEAGVVPNALAQESYDDYNAMAVFWEIGTQAEEELEGQPIDVDRDMELKIFRGRPKPRL